MYAMNSSNIWLALKYEYVQQCVTPDTYKHNLCPFGKAEALPQSRAHPRLAMAAENVVGRMAFV